MKAVNIEVIVRWFNLHSMVVITTLLLLSTHLYCLNPKFVRYYYYYYHHHHPFNSCIFVGVKHKGIIEWHRKRSPVCDY